MIKKIEAGLKNESYLSLFWRFLRFGLLAWGGPISQLALIRKELVDKFKLVSGSFFNQLIAIYQLIPGPETHEICVAIGTMAKGKWGGFLAGLGFMLPGFVLTVLISWLYSLFGITVLFAHLLTGIKPAVIAWITFGGIQLGKSILLSYQLWLVAILAFMAQLFNIHFIIIFLFSGLLYLWLMHKKEDGYWQQFSIILLLSIVVVVIFTIAFTVFGANSTTIDQVAQKPSLFAIFVLGLKAGSLSFGSVYTIISILKNDAIVVGKWMTESQLIDGLALTGALPAPFIIVTTFCGFLAQGFLGSFIITLGTFLPAFLIPMFAHKYLNVLSENSVIRTFIDGVTAGAAGLIAAEILDILRHVIINKMAIGIFIISSLFLYFSRSSYAIIWIVLMGALLGILFNS